MFPGRIILSAAIFENKASRGRSLAGLHEEISMGGTLGESENAGEREASAAGARPKNGRAHAPSLARALQSFVVCSTPMRVG